MFQVFHNVVSPFLSRHEGRIDFELAGVAQRASELGRAAANSVYESVSRGLADTFTALSRFMRQAAEEERARLAQLEERERGVEGAGGRRRRRGREHAGGHANDSSSVTIEEVTEE